MALLEQLKWKRKVFLVFTFHMYTKGCTDNEVHTCTALGYCIRGKKPLLATLTTIAMVCFIVADDKKLEDGQLQAWELMEV